MQIWQFFILLRSVLTLSTIVLSFSAAFDMMNVDLLLTRMKIISYHNKLLHAYDKRHTIPGKLHQIESFEITQILLARTKVKLELYLIVCKSKISNFFGLRSHVYITFCGRKKVRAALLRTTWKAWSMDSFWSVPLLIKGQVPKWIGFR